MSQPPEPPSRPSLVDYLAILGGMALSVYLISLSPLTAVPSNPVSPRVAQAFAFLATAARLPEGIVLLWPLFFLTQFFSRTDGLTAGEWLWLLSFVGTLLLTALTAWQYLLGLPESFQPHAAKPRVLWHLTLPPALAGLALLVLAVDLFRARPTPWTHNFGLALVLWPAAPSLVVLAGGEFVAK